MRKFKICLSVFMMALTIIMPLQIASGAESTTGIDLPVIMYHHINKNPKYLNNYTVSPDEFRRDLEYLKDNGYQTVSASQLIGFTQGKEQLPEKPIMLTFDDGFESFLVYALPLLEEYGMTAIIALVGEYTDNASASDDHNVNYSYLTWQQLEEVSNSPYAEIAVHTYGMHSLGGRSGCKIKKGEDIHHFKTEFNNDLEKIETELCDNLGLKSHIFAYPFGMYCKEAKEVLIERQYQVVFTCEERVNRLSGDPTELLSLGRFNRPSGISSAEFFKRVK